MCWSAPILEMTRGRFLLPALSVALLAGCNVERTLHFSGAGYNSVGAGSIVVFSGNAVVFSGVAREEFDVVLVSPSLKLLTGSFGHESQDPQIFRAEVEVSRGSRPRELPVEIDGARWTIALGPRTFDLLAGRSFLIEEEAGELRIRQSSGALEEAGLSAEFEEQVRKWWP